MSKQIYWGVVQNKPDNWGGKKLFPNTLHNTKHGADMQMLQWNKNWRKKEYRVKRFILDTKTGVHYDVYEHSYKRINK